MHSGYLVVNAKPAYTSISRNIFTDPTEEVSCNLMRRVTDEVIITETYTYVNTNAGGLDSGFNSEISSTSSECSIYSLSKSNSNYLLSGIRNMIEYADGKYSVDAYFSAGGLGLNQYSYAKSKYKLIIEGTGSSFDVSYEGIETTFDVAVNYLSSDNQLYLFAPISSMQKLD